MTVTPIQVSSTHSTAAKTSGLPVVTWEPLPEDFRLPNDPVDNTGQPLLAGALHESLELAGLIQPHMLIATNFGLCATLNGKFTVKAPDWVYVPNVMPLEAGVDRKSYTPHLEGDLPVIVMEFLSDEDGEEYSSKQTYPPGKWFFYEQILQVPYYAIFEPISSALELYVLAEGRYQFKASDENDRNWIAPMNLFLGAWRGEKEGRNGYWLRWWDADGNILPWAVERLAQEQQKLAQERRRAEQAEQQRQQLLDQLRNLDPAQLQALGIHLE
ncbi:MAG: Uma2 family endonuclease [Cyanobacteria bacterium]|nr:Uma2 family endonuclease [Cyanobacteriota bacterium]MDW8201971.1 Uma2 family endonuclease [Cyanobacteriota bacterium SKYGB_h_bin112]